MDTNLSVLAARVPHAGLVPAVKADGYGHGIEAVSRACVEWGAPMLAVANLQEFLHLRALHVTVPVLILEELFPDELEAAVREGARLSIGSLSYARELGRIASQLNLPARSHINLDTGMGRMGLPGGQYPVERVVELLAIDGIEAEGIYSHFPGSDEADTQPSLEQIHYLDTVVDELAARGHRFRYRHIANSGALLNFPDRVNWELARPGVAVYGMYPSRDVDESLVLRPAMRLVSQLVKVTRHERATDIGYGRTFQAAAGSLIGIVPIGYGDGYSRLLSNRASVLVGGRRVPVVGRVSMDMISVDLSNLDPAPVRGSEVVLLGSQGEEVIDARELAELAGTISYEVTCAVAPRVPRVYLRAGRPVAVRTADRGYRELPPAEAASLV